MQEQCHAGHGRSFQLPTLFARMREAAVACVHGHSRTENLARKFRWHLFSGSPLKCRPALAFMQQQRRQLGLAGD